MQENFRYCMYMRPVWLGLKLSETFELVEVEDRDKHPFSGRVPHSVFITEKPLKPEEVKNLEITDLQELKKDKENYDYIQSLDLSQIQEFYAELIKEYLWRDYEKGKIEKSREGIDSRLKGYLKQIKE